MRAAARYSAVRGGNVTFEEWFRWTAIAPRACRAILPDAHPADRNKARHVLDGGLPDVNPIAGVGLCWFPVATAGWPEGGVARVVARTLGDPNDLGRRVGRWLRETAGLPEAPSLHVEAYPSAGPPVDGDSLEVAALIASVSLLLHAPPRMPPVVSGRLGTTPGTLDSIDGIGVKRRALARELDGHDVWTLVVANDGVPACDALAPLFGDRWTEHLRDRLTMPLHQTIARAWERYRQGDREACRDLPSPDDTPGIVGRDRIQLGWMRAALATHDASGDALARYTDLERQIRAERPFALSLLREFDAFVAIAELDAGRPHAARSRLEAARDALRQAHRDNGHPPDTAWVWASISVLGSLHRACVVCGDLDAAAEALTESLQASLHLPSERARILGDLADVHRRQGDLGRARQILVQAEHALVDTYAEARTRTVAYQRVFRRRARLDRDPVPPSAATTRAYMPEESLHLEWLAQDAPTRLQARIEHHMALDPESVRHFAKLMHLLGIGARARRAHPDVPQPWLDDLVPAFCHVCEDVELKDCANAVLRDDTRFADRAGY